MKKPIQVTRSSMPPFEEYVKEIKDLWETRWLTNMGSKHNQLEDHLSKYLQVPNVSLFTNGHLALEIAIESLGLTGEVITTPFTFASTTHAIVRKGLTPIFCDINPNDYTIEVDAIEELITDKTSAIIPVHVYGNICDVNGIEKIAKKYNLKVIYDAAHAFGITMDGESIANFGDISMFSFHATKVFNTIEGGALTFNKVDLKNIINSYKNFGITSPESVDYIGGNAKMNEFQAAMGLTNLKYVNKDINKREEIYNKYVELLKDLEGIKLSPPSIGIKSNFAYFPVVFDNYKYNRDEVLERLSNENIYARKYFYPLTSEFTCYQNSFDIQETPVAEYIAQRVLTLPLFPDLPLSAVERICEIIKN